MNNMLLSAGPGRSIMFRGHDGEVRLCNGFSATRNKTKGTCSEPKVRLPRRAGAVNSVKPS